jgi:hypothetical protein
MAKGWAMRQPELGIPVTAGTGRGKKPFHKASLWKSYTVPNDTHNADVRTVDNNDLGNPEHTDPHAAHSV